MRSRQSCRTMLAFPSTPMTILSSRFNNHNFSIYSFNVVNHRRCIMLNLNKTITVGWPWWWDRQSRPIQQVKSFPKTQASKMITQECSFCSGLVWKFLLLPPPCTGMWIAKQTWGALCLSNWSWRKNYLFFKNTQVANPRVCIPHPCPQSGLCYIWLQVEKITMIIVLHCNQRLLLLLNLFWHLMCNKQSVWILQSCLKPNT